MKLWTKRLCVLCTYFLVVTSALYINETVLRSPSDAARPAAAQAAAQISDPAPISPAPAAAGAPATALAEGAPATALAEGAAATALAEGAAEGGNGSAATAGEEKTPPRRALASRKSEQRRTETVPPPPAKEIPPEPVAAPAGAPEAIQTLPAPEQTKTTAPQTADPDTDLNSYIQEVIATYEGRHYPYLLDTNYATYNGVTENLYFNGRLLARAHPSGNRASHCVGVTFEVFFKAMQARNSRLGLDRDDFNGMTYDDLFDFLLTWYVASGNKQTANIEIAVERYGIGKRVGSLEAARRGDFVDLSRLDGTGHTVVLQNWVRDSSGRIIGIHYWSSQGSTNGIGWETEYFASSGRGNVLDNQVYIARVLPVHAYRPFRS